MVGEPVEIRPYRPGDEVQINGLFNRVFGKTRTLGEWRWKYAENPLAGKDLSRWVTVAETGGSIIGHYASLPVEIKCGDGPKVAGQPVETMIDPGTKTGIGLLRELLKRHYEYNGGVAFFGFGFPNDAHHKVGRRLLGYNDIGEMTQMFRRLSLRGALRRRFERCPAVADKAVHSLSRAYCNISIPARGGLALKTVSEFDERAETLWEGLEENYRISVVRNLPYLNWRYGGGRYRKLVAEEGSRLAGWAVARVEDHRHGRTGYIIDVLYRRDRTGAMIRALLKYFMDMDVDFVLCGALREDLLFLDLEREGFREHRDIKPIPVVGHAIKGEIDEAYLLDRRNWHLTYGDTDGF